MMYFVYAIILLIIYLIVKVNIQPLKKTSICCPSTDQVFLIMLSLCYATPLGRSVTKTDSYYIGITLLTFPLGFLPLLYITYVITSWLISKFRFIHPLVNKFRHQH